MKNKLIIAALAGASIFAAAPASATVLVAGSPTAVTFSAFDTTTRGSVVAGTFTSQAGQSPTIAGVLTAAVYLNSFNTLDFYFQVARTGPGTSGSNMIDALNVSNYTGYSVDALVSGDGSFDGAGGFVNTFNPDENGASISTTSVQLTTGGVVQIGFGPNGLANTENSAIYILRTNAVNTNQLGFAVVTNSTGFNVSAFQPVAPSVPEPATWGMLLVGFGLVGAATRRSRRVTAVAA